MILRKIKNSAEKLVGTSLKDHKNFGLSESKYELLVLQLKEGNEAILIHIHKFGFNDAINYLWHRYRMSKDLAHDICMDTLVEFRDKILLKKIAYGNLRFLFTRMSMNNLMDYYKREEKINTCISDLLRIENANKVDQSHLFDLLNLCIEELDQNSKTILKDIFYNRTGLKELAEEYGISYSNIRKRKERAVTKLRKRFFIRYHNEDK